jgi:hypothetical protein
VAPTLTSVDAHRERLRAVGFSDRLADGEPVTSVYFSALKASERDTDWSYSTERRGGPGWSGAARCDRETAARRHTEPRPTDCPSVVVLGPTLSQCGKRD